MPRYPKRIDIIDRLHGLKERQRKDDISLGAGGSANNPDPGGSGGGVPSYMKVTAAGGQVIGGGGATPIDFDTVAESVGTVFSLEDAGKLTVAEDGVYLFGTQYSGNLSGDDLITVNARLERNGADDFGNDYVEDLGTGAIAVNFAVPVEMAAGDYVESLVWPTPPGASVTVVGDGTDPDGPILWGIKPDAATAGGGGGGLSDWADLTMIGPNISAFPGARTPQFATLGSLVFLRGAVSVDSGFDQFDDYVVVPGLTPTHIRYFTTVGDTGSGPDVTVTFSTSSGDGGCQLFCDYPAGSTGNFYLDGGVFSL